MIEKYDIKGDGYNPFLIREGWQVAQLNYVEKHGLDDIDNIEVHKKTDEVFILFKGTGVLIAVEKKDNKINTQVINMKFGVTYNIPAGTWHNIAMDKDASMFIIEKDNTHLYDCQYIDLSDSEKQDIYKQIKDIVKIAL